MSKLILRQAQAFGSEVFDREAQTESAQVFDSEVAQTRGARRDDAELSRSIKTQIYMLNIFSGVLTIRALARIESASAHLPFEI